MNFLTAKIGPLPAWAWGLVAGGGLLAFRFIRGGSSSSEEVPAELPAGAYLPTYDPRGAAADVATGGISIDDVSSAIILALDPLSTQVAGLVDDVSELRGDVTDATAIATSAQATADAAVGSGGAGGAPAPAAPAPAPEPPPVQAPPAPAPPATPARQKKTFGPWKGVSGKKTRDDYQAQHERAGHPVRPWSEARKDGTWYGLDVWL